MIEDMPEDIVTFFSGPLRPEWWRELSLVERNRIRRQYRWDRSPDRLHPQTRVQAKRLANAAMHGILRMRERHI